MTLKFVQRVVLASMLIKSKFLCHQIHNSMIRILSPSHSCSFSHSNSWGK